MTAEQDAVTLRVVKAIAGDYGKDNGVDPDELLWFANEDGSVRICANCSDFFAWASADAEPITPDNIEVFEQAVRDVVAADIWTGYSWLFAVRMRRQMPMTYRKPRDADDHRLWELFAQAAPTE